MDPRPGENQTRDQHQPTAGDLCHPAPGASRLDQSHRHSENGRTAPGKNLAYTLSIGQRCDCTGRVHVTGTVTAEWVQLVTSTGATFGHRSGATNGCNAAGQNRRQNRGITEEEEEEEEGSAEDQEARPITWTAEQREAGRRFIEIMAANGPDPWQ
jgi:hypothetical protein